MSRIAWLVCALGLVLTASHGVADDPPGGKKLDLVFAHETKVKFEGQVVSGSVTELMDLFRKAHGVEIVIADDEFRAAGIGNFKDRVSRMISTKGLTVRQFLDVWLAGVGAEYKLEPKRIVIVPAPKWDAKTGERVRPDALAITLAVLETEVQFREGLNLNETSLHEILVDFSKRYQLTFVINEESFKAAGVANIGEEKLKVASTALRGLRIPPFLNIALDGLGATYLLKNDTIEIVTVAYAAKVTKAAVSQDEHSRPRLIEPLVSAIFKEKPLNEAVAKLAEAYDLTVVVAPQAADAKAGFVTARLLNTPADKAIELLALQADLRVVRRGAAYLITSKDHANELFNEKLDRERQKIEVEKLREAPAKPPAPPEPPKPEEKKP